MLDQGFEPLRILAGLRSHGVLYVLVGGLAVAVRGGPLDTDDVDICLPDDPENIPRLALALQQLGAQIDAGASTADRRVSYQTRFGRLDCLELPSEFDVLMAHAEDVDVGHGVKTRVASLEDLTRMKRTSPDLEGAVRMQALITPTAMTREELTGPVDADPEPNGRFERLMKRLADVDGFLTDVNTGKRAPLRKKH
jgi:hypothetical protein